MRSWKKSGWKSDIRSTAEAGNAKRAHATRQPSALSKVMRRARRRIMPERETTAPPIPVWHYRVVAGELGGCLRRRRACNNAVSRVTCFTTIGPTSRAIRHGGRGSGSTIPQRSSRAAEIRDEWLPCRECKHIPTSDVEPGKRHADDSLHADEAIPMGELRRDR